MAISAIDGTAISARGLMRDFIFAAITLAFFVLSIAYVHFCERVK
jgi:hypothetical protein